METQLQQLFSDWAKEPVLEMKALPLSGSQRRYWRIRSQNYKIIGTQNPNYAENQLFLDFTEYFQQQQVRVPRVYAKNLDKGLYLLEDLGDTSLLDYLHTRPSLENIRACYEEALRQLAHIQLFASAGIDWEKHYPNGEGVVFDTMMMRWDLDYFKYWFVMPSKIEWNEYRLEQDFRKFLNQLDKANPAYFMYRDFQARNIMLHQNQLYFIDYQGAKQGALQYDVASLLYQAKANLPQSLREELLQFYIRTVETYIPIDRLEFEQMYYRFVLLRLLQVLGAYGYRGLYEGKPHFRSSIPMALANVQSLREQHAYLFAQFPELSRVLERLIQVYKEN